ncbi:hypothetical protein Hanom_Chr13g01183011 [Helianthus anomalus]
MNMSGEQGMSEVVVVPTVVSKVSRGFQFSDSGIAYWIVLSEVDLLFLKGMLGDNWVFRMFNEKLEIGSSDLRVSFKSESDLVGFGVAGLYGSVQELLAGIVQVCDVKSVDGDLRNILKFPQLDINANAFEFNSNANFVLLNKRKKRSV